MTVTCQLRICAVDTELAINVVCLSLASPTYQRNRSDETPSTYYILRNKRGQSVVDNSNMYHKSDLRGNRHVTCSKRGLPVADDFYLSQEFDEMTRQLHICILDTLRAISTVYLSLKIPTSRRNRNDETPGTCCHIIE